MDVARNLSLGHSSLPPSPPSPSLPLIPKNLARRCGERCELPQWGLGSTRCYAFLALKRISWHHFSHLCAMQMTISRRPRSRGYISCMGLMLQHQ